MIAGLTRSESLAAIAVAAKDRQKQRSSRFLFQDLFPGSAFYPIDLPTEFLAQ